MSKNKPNYKSIFEDIILKKCPERINEFKKYLDKQNFSVIDIIALNNKLFGLSDKETNDFNQKHKSYDIEGILHMLTYQQKQKLTNMQLAAHFKLSRNTVAKWRKIYM